MNGVDFSIIFQNSSALFQGFLFSLGLSVLAALIGGIGLGTLLAVARGLPYPFLQKLIGAYVNLVRATPFLMVVFWFYFLLPQLIKFVMHLDRADGIPAFYSVLMAFSLFEAAYFSEIIRAGIQAVSKGQNQAACALGLSTFQQYRWVILPQAFKKMRPVLLTQCIILFQDTSVVYVVGLADFMSTIKRIAERDGRMVEGYIFAAIVYGIVSFCASKWVDSLKEPQLKSGK